MLAWRLVDTDLLRPARHTPDQGGAGWVLPRLLRHHRGWDPQRVDDALPRAERLAPRPLDGLYLLADHLLVIEDGEVSWRRERDPWWIALVVEPDALAAAFLARLAVGTVPHHVLAWPPGLAASRSAFDAALRAPLAETHLHLGGGIPTSVLWNSLLDDAPIAPGFPPDGAEGLAWRERLVRARAFRDDLAKLVGPPPDPPGETDLAHRLFPERWLLFRACQEWLRPPARRVGDTARPTVEDLLEYLKIRNSFHRALLHGGEGRGLNRFIESFDRRAFAATVGGAGDARRGALRRSEEARMRLALEHAVSGMRLPTDGDHPRERTVELRVHIPCGEDAIPTLQGWASAIAEVAARPGNQRLRVGLVHNFIKGWGEGKGALAEHEVQVILALIKEHPALRHLVVGFDAAGRELDCPPRAFAGAVKTIRDHADRLAAQSEGPAWHPGVTWHVGEDFRDLLTGLRRVHEVCTFFELRPGDRLGHGLALAWCPIDWYRDAKRPHALVNERILDLLWAIQLLQREDRRHHRALQVAERHLREVARAAEVKTERLSLPVVIDALLDPAPLPSARSEGEILEALGLRPGDDRLAPPAHRDPVWPRLVRLVQRVVWRRVRELGLTVEVNPTSNLIIHALDFFEQLPYLRLWSRGLTRKGPCANIPISINTDDPGLFLTSLRREYQVMGEALQRTHDTAEVVDWLKGVRRNGTESTFVRRGAPEGAQLAEVLRMSGWAHRPHG